MSITLNQSINAVRSPHIAHRIRGEHDMAFPTYINEQITDSVTQANTKVLADAPPIAMGNLYRATAQALAKAAPGATNAASSTAMTVSVAGRPVHGLTGISEPARVVLGFVDDGLAWLSWAISNPAVRCHFEDESRLLAEIQAGLHASNFLLLPTLGVLVGPVKLMTIGLADLRTLEHVESGNATAPVIARAGEILSAHGLVTQAQLAGGMDQLGQWKVAANPLFQCMNFSDQRALFGLLDDPGPPHLAAYRQEAATFAAAAAATPLEFCDYFRAYLQLIAKAATLQETPAQRQALVEAALETLSPLMFGALDCPRVEGPVAPREVALTVEEWLMMGRRLGFSRLSLGVQQVIANTGFKQEVGTEAAMIVDAYLAGANRLLQSNDLGPGQLGQDGACCAFQVSSGRAQAVVDLQPNGNVTLASYAPSPLATPKKKK